MSEQDNLLVDGLFFNKKHENAPDFVKGSLSIQVDRFVAYLQANKKPDGYVNLDFLKSKQGKLYFKRNDWKPENSEQGSTEINPEDVPF